MLDPQVEDAGRDQLAADAKARLEAQGTLNYETSWGLRKMAYEIEQRGEADYRYFRFTGEKPLLDDLNHNLLITDGVLRFRVFKVDPESPTIVPPDTEQVMRRDEDDRDRGRGRGRRDDRGGDRGGRRPREAGGEDSAPAPSAPAPAAAAAAPAPAAAPAASASAPAPAAAPPAAEPGADSE